MNTLIVTAHPLEDSLCQHLCNEVCEDLKAKGMDYRVKNLYQQGFDPVLNTSERESYYQKPFDDSLLKEDIQELQNAERIILIFPTWWFGFPAILKGWFDRVWAPTFAYDHASDFGPIKPRLKNLKDMVAITTLGSPGWVDRFVLRQPVKKVLRLALLGACARQSKFKMFSLYKSEKLTKDKVEGFVGKIRKRL